MSYTSYNMQGSPIRRIGHPSVTLTLPDGTTRTKVLDERSRLDSVYLDGIMVADYVYNNNTHTGTNFGNGIEASYGRDVAGRLTSMAYGKGDAAAIMRHDLGWDVAGQLQWAKKTPDAIADERYGMDSEGQLTEWKTGALDVTNAIAAPVDSLGWNLDARGNWTNVYDSKVVVDSRTHSAANAINTRNGVAFKYDVAGNLLGDGVNAYEWTLDGLLAKVSTASDTVQYAYDGQRRLVTRMVKTAGVASSDTYVWDGWQLAQEYRSGAANTYAYGNYIDDVVAVHVAGGNTPGTYYYHQGYNHDVEAITNASGQVVERYSIKPYGEFTVSTDGVDGLPGTVDDVRYTQSTIGNKIVFQGRPFDEVTGLYDFRNRQYSAMLGRFMSRDPAGPLVNLGLNLYQAFDLNPAIFLDPWGLAALTKSVGIGKLSINYDGIREPSGIPLVWGNRGMSIQMTFEPDKCPGCDQSYFKQWVMETNLPRSGCGDAPYPDPCLGYNNQNDDPRFDNEGKRETWIDQGVVSSSLYENGGAYMDDRPSRQWYPGRVIKWKAKTEVWCIKEGKESRVGMVNWGFTVSKDGQMSVEAR